jgi:DNA-3-methyladenine glycosylase
MDMTPDRLRTARLGRDFFARDALAVAKGLIGCSLVRELGGGAVQVARIVETEAYRGPRDLACHARAGLTRRTRSLLGAEGHAYVFLVYGMHECFNVTCRREGAGHAVLIRAAEPLRGFDAGARLDGPGRFAKGMGLSRANDGADLTEPPLYLCPRDRRPRLVTTARVGVAYAGEFADVPWRFYDAASDQVSRPPKSSIGRRGRGGQPPRLSAGAPSALHFASRDTRGFRSRGGY